MGEWLLCRQSPMLTAAKHEPDPLRYNTSPRGKALNQTLISLRCTLLTTTTTTTLYAITITILTNEW